MTFELRNRRSSAPLNKITGANAGGRRRLATLISLRSLYLGNQNLSDNALAELQRRLPNLVMHRPQ